MRAMAGAMEMSMTRISKTAFRMAALSLALAGATTAASAQGRWDYGGGRSGDREYGLVGPGVPLLLPELRRSNRGRAFVMRNFDANRDGRINRSEAETANAAFAELAGSRRDRFDWDSRDRDGRDRVVVDEGRRGGWDRHAMRDYRFRQTPAGATMTMEEQVLFQTDSAVLRPGAIDRLRPLADFLRSEPGVRVAIVGHTDSRGTDAHNQQLSEARAESVRAAFDEMGVTRARFQVEGRGESEPAASNATADGMRLNRRVEVTLLGQRAERFQRED
jgi:outer membrane protein OmpA-like peptidoglycan-associated protein